MLSDITPIPSTKSFICGFASIKVNNLNLKQFKEWKHEYKAYNIDYDSKDPEIKGVFQELIFQQKVIFIFGSIH